MNNRETDRHRLIMCHCHFLYDCIYYPPIRSINRLIRQHKRSLKRGKSTSQSLYGSTINIDDNFCPYTRKNTSNIDENQMIKKKKFEIGCPMEETCADIRTINEYFSRSSIKTDSKK